MIWNLIARLVSRPTVRWWLIRRAQRTPYTPIMSRDGSELYMQRWWLFNPYSRSANGDQAPARIPWLPSVRIHHILRPDSDRHLHDHPWDARTIVLQGWYREQRPFAACSPDDLLHHSRGMHAHGDQMLVELERQSGYTGPVRFGQYHRISELSNGGAYTLFITWGALGTWGFLVDGAKVPHHEYHEVKS